MVLICTMSIDAQLVKIYRGDQLIIKHKVQDGDKVVFEADTPTTGKATRTDNIEVNWVQLWEDGPKFAEYNVGADNNKPEDYGGYYTWGGKHKNGSDTQWIDDHNAGADALKGEYDTATQLWGDNWRMPTKEELEALLDNCDKQWTTVEGVNGYKFTGRDEYSSNSIFLPAAGSCHSGGNVAHPSEAGKYWSSTPEGNDAKSMEYNSIMPFMTYGYRNNGYSVRAVLK